MSFRLIGNVFGSPIRRLFVLPNTKHSTLPVSSGPAVSCVADTLVADLDIYLSIQTII